MQKITNIFVLIIFLTSTVGVKTHKHYSNGKLYRVTVFQEKENCCTDLETCNIVKADNSCKHTQNNHCSCEDITEVFKISEILLIKKQVQFKNIDNLLFPFKSYSKEVITSLTLQNLETNISRLPTSSLDVQSEFGVYII